MLYISNEELKNALKDCLSEIEDIDYLLKNEINMSSIDELFITNKELDGFEDIYDTYDCDNMYKEYYKKLRRIN